MTKNLKATESTATAAEVTEPTYAEVVSYVAAFIAADKAIEDAERSMSDALTHAPDVARRLASAPRGAARRLAEDVVLGVAKSEKADPARLAAAKASKKAIDAAAVAVGRLSLYGRIAIAHPALDLSAIRKACNAANKRGVTAEAIVAAATGVSAAKALAAIDALKVAEKREARPNDGTAEAEEVEAEEAEAEEVEEVAPVQTVHSLLVAASGPFAAALKACQTEADYAEVAAFLRERIAITVNAAKAKGLKVA